MGLAGAVFRGGLAGFCLHAAIAGRLVFNTGQAFVESSEQDICCGLDDSVRDDGCGRLASLQA